MANGLQEVRPGDIISAELMNNLLKAVNDIESKLSGIEGLLAGPGQVVVPNVFGLSLSAAKAEVTKPKYGLQIGDVFNTGGQRIFPENIAALELSVLNQVPEAGRIVDVGSKVGMVIAQLASSGGTGGGIGATGPNHQVTGVLPPEGKAADGEVTVVGTGFITPFSRNHVIFDGTFTQIPKPGSTVTGLVVDIPRDLPGLPRDVAMAVEIDGVTRVMPTLYHVLPVSVTSELKIKEMPTRVRENATLAIVGTGFSPTPDQNKVTFIFTPNPALRQVVVASAFTAVGEDQQLTVTVPLFSNAAMRPADTGTQYNVTVHIGSDTTKVANGSIEIRPPIPA
jgi:hypothetical protein